MQSDSPQRKLTLHEETLRRLDVDEMRQTKGGLQFNIPRNRQTAICPVAKRPTDPAVCCTLTCPVVDPPVVVYSFAGMAC